MVVMFFTTELLKVDILAAALLGFIYPSLIKPSIDKCLNTDCILKLENGWLGQRLVSVSSK